MCQLEQFKRKAFSKYGSKYDYSEFVYVNAKTPSIIICPMHGRFLQKPDHHLRKTAIGCPQCVPLLKRPRRDTKPVGPNPLSKSEYLRRVVKVHGSKFEYDLSEYEGLTRGSVSISCPFHGKSSYVPRSLLISKCGCRRCGNETSAGSKTKSYPRLIEELSEMYGDKYVYPESNISRFKNRRSVLEIVCKIHGVFRKSGAKHRAGQECPKCTILKLIQTERLTGGYCSELFKTKPWLKAKPAIVYYLEINSSLYKIGITSTSTKARIKSLKSKSKGFIEDVRILSEVHTDLFNAYKLEQALLSKFKTNRVYFEWSTELFNYDVLNGKLPA